MESHVLPEAGRRRILRRRLMDWFASHKRELPWRSEKDPYAIWVSEMMLQQTQVATVIPFYRRWMRRFPTVGALATASEGDVLQLWQGLGYYSRAKRLLQAARIVISDHGGHLPDSVDELQKLPGIGRYSAGAIASIAYDRPAPIVDGNVIRVLSRIEGLRGDPTRKPLSGHLWMLAEALIPRSKPGDFNEALMELGATLCSPRMPACATCPWRKECRAHDEGTQAQLPELPSRPPPTRLAMVAAIAVRKGRYLMIQAPESARRWSGLWLFPTIEHCNAENANCAAERALRELVGVEGRATESLTTIQHTVTRYRVTLSAVSCALPARSRPRALECHAISWVAPGELKSLPLPSPQRKLAGLLTRD